MSKSREIKDFCSDSKILCNTFSCEGDNIRFYLMSLDVNEIFKSTNTRLTITEKNVMAHLIDYTVRKGTINTKEAYDDVISWLIKKKVAKNKFSFTTTKTNLINKNYLLKNNIRNHIIIDERFLKIINLGQINIYISNH